MLTSKTYETSPAQVFILQMAHVAEALPRCLSSETRIQENKIIRMEMRAVLFLRKERACTILVNPPLFKIHRLSQETSFFFAYSTLLKVSKPNDESCSLTNFAYM